MSNWVAESFNLFLSINLIIAGYVFFSKFNIAGSEGLNL